jgi:hypothetical protein
MIYKLTSVHMLARRSISTALPTFEQVQGLQRLPALQQQAKFVPVQQAISRGPSPAFSVGSGGSGCDIQQRHHKAVVKIISRRSPARGAEAEACVRVKGEGAPR